LEVTNNVPVVECNTPFPKGAELILFKSPDGEERVGLKREEYVKLMDLLEKVLEENFQYQLEQEIIKNFPKDLEDVKSVVLDVMDENGDLSIPEAVAKVKLEHPNLFHQLDELQVINHMMESLEEIFEKQKKE